MAERLTIDETVALINSMAVIAGQDSSRLEKDEDYEASAYWEGWADGLLLLKNHIDQGVKVTCFPIGSCQCHPLKLSRQ